MEAYELLKQEIKNKSIGKVALELKLSKATVSLVARKKYPRSDEAMRSMIIKNRVDYSEKSTETIFSK